MSNMIQPSYCLLFVHVSTRTVHWAGPAFLTQAPCQFRSKFGHLTRTDPKMHTGSAIGSPWLGRPKACSVASKIFGQRQDPKGVTSDPSQGDSPTKTCSKPLQSNPKTYKSGTSRNMKSVSCWKHPGKLVLPFRGCLSTLSSRMSIPESNPFNPPYHCLHVLHVASKSMSNVENHRLAHRCPFPIGWLINRGV